MRDQGITGGARGGVEFVMLASFVELGANESSAFEGVEGLKCVAVLETWSMPQ